MAELNMIITTYILLVPVYLLGGIFMHLRIFLSSFIFGCA